MEALRNAAEQEAFGSVIEQVAKDLDALSVECSPSAAAIDALGGIGDGAEANAELLRWLTQGGAKFAKLDLRLYDDGFEYRGVHASEDIEHDEQLLSVPRHLIMTTELAKTSEIGVKLMETDVPLRSRHSFLAMMLLEERAKGQRSTWWPYIRTLPQRYRNMPINFSDKELKMLKGSLSLEKIWIRKQSLQQEFESICAKIPHVVDKFTLQDFTWARNVVITRVFGLIICGRKTEGLVPLADMLNHKRPRESKWTFDEFLDAFTIVASSKIEQGFSVTDSYGRKCNSRFFVNYGFSLEDNEDNETVVVVTLPADEPLYDAKKVLLGSRHEAIVQRSFQFSASSRHTKFVEAISLCRLAVANDDDVRYFRQPGLPLDRIGPISVRNEVKALALLKTAALQTLHGFDNDIDVDNKILEDTSLDLNTRNSVLMRRGEKQVCHWLIDLADSMGAALRDNKRDLSKVVQCSPLFKHYVVDVLVPLLGQTSQCGPIA